MQADKCLSIRNLIALLVVVALFHAFGATAAFAQGGGLAAAVANLRAIVARNCPAGSAIRALDVNGSVVCEVDDNNGGTITSVTVGAGLAGGGTTGDVTLSVATEGITGAMIQDSAVGSADVNFNEVQLRIAGTCPAGNAIQLVGADGTVICEPVGSIVGGGTANFVPIWTGPESLGDSVIFQDDLGRVGIGTTNLGLSFSNVGARTVTIEGGTASASDPALAILELNGLRTGPSTADAGHVAFFNNGSHVARIAGGTDGAPDLGSLRFVLQNPGDNLEVMRMRSSGNVGIGRPDPEFKLDVAGQVRALGFVTVSDGRLKTDVA